MPSRKRAIGEASSMPSSTLLAGLPAVTIDGPKAVGKTATALRRAATVYRLDDDAERTIALADPSRLLEGERPILIDEWQRLPESFDRMRRAVDDGASPVSFLLTGSASPTDPPTHSGAGRIVRVRLRPMTLSERGVGVPTVSLAQLLAGGQPPIAGRTDIGLERYVDEILSSGLPGIHGLPTRLARAQLDGYLERIVDRAFEDLGHRVRRPATLRRWMQAYAAATATTASFETIRDAASGDHGEKPTRATTQPYRDVLQRLWILDPVAAWMPTRSRLARLSSPPKHTPRRSRTRGSTARGGRGRTAPRPGGRSAGTSRRHAAWCAVRITGHALRARLRPSPRGTGGPPTHLERRPRS